MAKKLERVKSAFFCKALKSSLASFDISLGSSLVLLFFAWFFLLPSNFCSYAAVLADQQAISLNLFYISTNIAGFLGLITAGITTLFLKRTNRLLLIVSVLLLVVNVAIFSMLPRPTFVLMLLAYLLLGQYVALSTVLFFEKTHPRNRYFTIGIVLICISLFSLLFNTPPSEVTAKSIYISNLGMNVIAIPFVMILNIKAQSDATQSTSVTDNPLFRKTIAYNAVYILTFAFTLGFISNEVTACISSSKFHEDLIFTGVYIFVVLVLFLISKKQHFGISLYVSNMLLIIALALSHNAGSNALIRIILILFLSCSFAVNTLFIFDTILDLASFSKIPSFYICFNLGLFIAGNSFGDHLTEYFYQLKDIELDRSVISLVAIATCFLPTLRISLSKFTKDSIFRVNPVLVVENASEAVSNISEDFDSTTLAPLNNGLSKPCNYETLTNREKEVLNLLLSGFPGDLICSMLFISNNTLKRHTQNIYSKLGVHNRTELFMLFQGTTTKNEN